MKVLTLIVVFAGVICNCASENSTEASARQARERSVFSVRRIVTDSKPKKRISPRISAIGPSENDLHEFRLRPYNGEMFFNGQRPQVPPVPGFFSKDGHYLGSNVLSSHVEDDPVQTLIKSLLMPPQYSYHNNAHFPGQFHQDKGHNKRYYSYKPLPMQKPFRPSIQIGATDVIIGTNKVKPNIYVPTQTDTGNDFKYQKHNFYFPKNEDTASFQVGAKTQNIHSGESFYKNGGTSQSVARPEILSHSFQNTGGYFQPSQSYSANQANSFLSFMKSNEYFLPKLEPDYHTQNPLNAVYEVKTNNPTILSYLPKLNEIPTESFHFSQSPQIEIYPKTKTEDEKVIEFLPQKVEFTQEDAITVGYDYGKSTKEQPAPEIDIRARFESDSQASNRATPSKITLSKYNNFSQKKFNSKYTAPRPSDTSKLKGYEVYEKVQRRKAEDIGDYASAKTETLRDSKTCEKNCTETFAEHPDDEPVCGTDNQTYSSEDFLDCLNSCRPEESVIDIEYDGKCEEKQSEDTKKTGEAAKNEPLESKVEQSLPIKLPRS